MSIVGKTVATVDYNYGTTARIVFTDGTALDLRATGWEVEDLEWDELSPEEFRRRAAQEQGERERERVRRLEGEAIRAERQRRGEEEWYLLNSGFAKMIREEMHAAKAAYLLDMNRVAFTTEPPR